jgi:hypothetical protein
MKYFDELKKVTPGLKLGWLNPKNPHNCARTNSCPKDTAATNNEATIVTPASPVEAAKDTAASQPVSTETTARPFKKVLE